MIAMRYHRGLFCVIVRGEVQEKRGVFIVFFIMQKLAWPCEKRYNSRDNKPCKCRNDKPHNPSHNRFFSVSCIRTPEDSRTELQLQRTVYDHHNRNGSWNPEEPIRDTHDHDGYIIIGDIPGTGIIGCDTKYRIIYLWGVHGDDGKKHEYTHKRPHELPWWKVWKGHFKKKTRGSILRIRKKTKFLLFLLSIRFFV